MTNGYDSHNGVWQVKKVHMAIDMYQGFLMATPQTGEAAKHVISHCLRCFPFMWYVIPDREYSNVFHIVEQSHVVVSDIEQSHVEISHAVSDVEEFHVVSDV